jgi:hypothetical protein
MSFSSLNVTRKRHLYEERAQKMLVKLTQGDEVQINFLFSFGLPKGFSG